ncbi:MAG TPA: hypothetical protein VFQ62_02225 [Methylomirabilota bacterium]|nr:hypothetical protein [Methylomirabilota bacterium]
MDEVLQSQVPVEAIEPLIEELADYHMRLCSISRLSMFATVLDRI